MKSATPRQLETLAIIAKHLNVRGFPPSLREIAEEMGMRGTQGAGDHIRALSEKGLLERDMRERNLWGRIYIGTLARSLRLTDAGRALVAQPTSAVRRALTPVTPPTRCECNNDTFAADGKCPGCRTGNPDFLPPRRKHAGALFPRRVAP